MRIGALDDFAVEFEDRAQHAMGRRMLRPKIHGVISNFRHDPCLFLNAKYGAFTMNFSEG